MSDISQWSPESGSEFNNAAPPNGAPEGMQPSGVNDVMREIMAAVRRQWQQAEWFEYGHEINRTSGTTFNIVGDQTAVYIVGRRVRVRGLATGTLLGTVTNSQYSVVTSVTITPDSGTIANEPITVEVGVNDPSQASISSQSIADLQTILNAINAKFNALNASNLTTGTVPRARLPAATTGAVGGVQLNNSINSGNTGQAATAAAVQTVATGRLGSNQTWATPGRSTNTIYTNSTVRPIVVNIGFTTGGPSSNALQIRPPGGGFVSVAQASGNAGINASAIVPAGWQYRATISHDVWAELR